MHVFINIMITTKEQLRSHIHGIHDYIRNSGAGYGMTAMKIFNVFYGLRLLGNRKEFKGFTFEDLLKLADSEQSQDYEKLASLVNKDLLDKLSESFRDLFFYEIPRNLKAEFYKDIIKMIDEIPIGKGYQVDLAGKVYEYFIGRDQSAISELGAYFTDRHITSYIIDQLDPVTGSMIDPFGGSGGFTLTYIHYLKNKYPKLDWTKEIKNIHHYDMNEDVVKLAGVEIFALTGYIPDTDSNIRTCNSFKITQCK